jgi:hypothetical protein
MNNNLTSNQNQKNANETSIWEALKNGLKAIDVHAWPAFIMFLLLVGTETTANIISSVQDFGLIVALFIGVLFGVFLAGWHIVSERPLNSVRQQSISHAMTGLTTGGAILLLIVNLIRLSSNGNINLTTSLLPTTTSIGGWDVVAIIIIGTMFAAHLIGYQLWHSADDIRKMKREHNQELGKVIQKQNSINLAIKSSEAELKSIEAELNSVNDLKTQYSHLPSELLDPILEEARNKVRAEFKKAPVQSSGQNQGGNNNQKQSIQNNPRQELQSIRFGQSQQSLANDTESEKRGQKIISQSRQESYHEDESHFPQENQSRSQVQLQSSRPRPVGLIDFEKNKKQNGGGGNFQSR